MNFQNAEFITSWFNDRTLTLALKPEIVFVGKSNVGKSSMINKILNRKSFARTSSKPGKTVSINFFGIDKQAYLVDLPGYGFAKRSKAERENWGSLIEDYFDLDRDIRMVFLLIDIRHDPSENDIMMYNYLMSKNYLFCVAATKADKLSKTAAEAQAKKLSDKFGVSVIPFSAEKGTGVSEIRQIIEDSCNDLPSDTDDIAE